MTYEQAREEAERAIREQEKRIRLAGARLAKELRKDLGLADSLTVEFEWEPILPVERTDPPAS